MGVLTSWMERHMVGAQGSEFAFSIADRILIAGRAVWFYVTKLLWPNPLIFMYPRWRIDDHTAWQYVFPVSVALAILALWVLRTRIGRGPLVAALFICGSLVPALGFVNVLPMRYSFVADHFQYLASIGLITLLAAGLATYLSARHVLPVTGILCMALTALTWQHAKDFKNLESLWERTLAKNPSSWMAHNNYGALLMARRDDPAAAEHFRRTIELKPDHDQARLNLA
jgi:tetratricopeptide (TPR) repeat protein